MATLETPQGGAGNSRELKSFRRVDLTAFLDGTYKAPEPSLGGIRDDGAFLLYPAKWHTVIAPTEAGKSWLATWQCAAVMLAGGIVVYLHFEESDAGTTVGRLLEIGLTPEMISKQFIFLDCNEPWTRDEISYELSLYPSSLVVLDGINEACSMHGWDAEKVLGVGLYRATFVKPACSVGSTPLSLGHPVKSVTRQNERDGFGSVQWLATVDGVGFRLIPSKDNPIGRSRAGSSALYSVKDRNGNVNKVGIPVDNKSGWYYQGQFIIDDTRAQFDHTSLRLSKPGVDNAEERNENVEKLAVAILEILNEVKTHRYESESGLMNTLKEKKVKFNKNHVPLALDLLERNKEIERAPVVLGKRVARPGWLREA